MRKFICKVIFFALFFGMLLQHPLIALAYPDTPTPSNNNCVKAHGDVPEYCLEFTRKNDNPFEYLTIHIESLEKSSNGTFNGITFYQKGRASDLESVIEYKENGKTFTKKVQQSHLFYWFEGNDDQYIKEKYFNLITNYDPNGSNPRYIICPNAFNSDDGAFSYAAPVHQDQNKSDIPAKVLNDILRKTYVENQTITINKYVDPNENLTDALRQIGDPEKKREMIAPFFNSMFKDSGGVWAIFNFRFPNNDANKKPEAFMLGVPGKRPETTWELDHVNTAQGVSNADTNYWYFKLKSHGPETSDEAGRSRKRTLDAIKDHVSLRIAEWGDTESPPKLRVAYVTSGNRCNFEMDEIVGDTNDNVKDSDHPMATTMIDSWEKTIFQYTYNYVDGGKTILNDTKTHPSIDLSKLLLTGDGNPKVRDINLNPLNKEGEMGYLKKWIGETSVCRNEGGVFGDTNVTGGGKVGKDGCPEYEMFFADEDETSDPLNWVLCKMARMFYDLGIWLLGIAEELAMASIGADISK